MKSDQHLDISEIVIPFSLALCKFTMDKMPAGAVLHIRLRDHDTLKDLMFIIERSDNDILAWEKQEDGYQVWVRKSRDGLSANRSD